MPWSWKKTALVTLAGAGAAAACALTAGAAAPVIGAWVGGTFMGLSGAAATSAGLAALGGGSLAAGGLGVAGGATVVAAVGGAAGGATASIVAKKIANHLVEGRHCPSCDLVNSSSARFCQNCGKPMGSSGA